MVKLAIKLWEMSSPNEPCDGSGGMASSAFNAAGMEKRSAIQRGMGRLNFELQIIGSFGPKSFQSIPVLLEKANGSFVWFGLGVVEVIKRTKAIQGEGFTGNGMLVCI